MGFPVYPKVQEDKVIRRLWFGEPGDRSGLWNQITPVRLKIINAYVDWRDFGIRPWNRSLPAEEIPQFWKDVLRSFRRLEQEVQDTKMKESRAAAKEMKAMGGKAPTPEAKKDYLTWRKKQIAEHEKQRQAHHTILEQQAIIRRQEHEKRQMMLASRKAKKPKRMRGKHLPKR